jgi:hypothetical protein
MTIIGTAEGTIMPTIITDHMTNTNANSIAGHGVCAGTISPMPDGIILKPAHVHAAHAYVGREP